MIYDCLFERSDSALNRFEMLYDYRFEMSGAVLYSFRYDIWLSFRNDGAKIFVQRIIFVSEGGLKPRDENAP